MQGRVETLKSLSQYHKDNAKKISPFSHLSFLCYGMAIFIPPLNDIKSSVTPSSLVFGDRAFERLIEADVDIRVVGPHGGRIAPVGRGTRQRAFSLIYELKQAMGAPVSNPGEEPSPETKPC